MRTIRKVFVYLVLFLLFVVISLVILGYLAQDKLVAYTLKKIEQEINVNVKVQDFKVSMLRDFPNASIILNNVEITEGSLIVPKELEPGLLKLEEVRLSIGMLGVFRQHYDLKELTLKNGWINLFFDNSGKGNYEVFSKKEGGTSDWLLSIDKFKLENVAVSYIDPITGWTFKGVVSDASLVGRFSTDRVLLALKSKLRIASLKQGALYYLKDQTTSVDLMLLIDSSTINFESKRVKLGKADVAINGSFGRDIGAPINLFVRGENLEVSTLVSILSQYSVAIPPETKTRGDIAFRFNLKGHNKVDKPFSLNLSFNTSALTVHLPGYPSFLLQNLTGTFDNGSSKRPEMAEVIISNFTFKTGNSNTSGSIRLKNINAPLYHFVLNNDLDVNDIIAWGVELPIESGLLVGSFEVIGILSNTENITLSDFSKSKYSADISFNKVNFSKNYLNGQLNEVSGSLTLLNRDITKANLKGKLHGSVFEGELRAVNAAALLFHDGKATINASLTIDSLNTSMFFASEASENNHSDVSTFDFISSISSDVFIDKFVDKKLVCQPFSANVYYKDRQLLSNSFFARTCDGIVTGTFGLSDGIDSSQEIQVNLTADGLDITKLFQSFDDFNQQTVKSSSISGRLDGLFQLSALYAGGEVNMNSVKAIGDLKLSNGRLVDVEQLKGLSKFISVDELSDIRFETLENRISIENGSIIVPRMSISSSALNLSLSGVHSFAGNYEYRFELLLSELLSKKAKRSKPENHEFGEVDSDGSLKLYIKIVGDESDFKVSYDGKAAREAFREQLRSERQSIKEIFREEFSFLRGREQKQEVDSIPQTPPKNTDSKDIKKNSGKQTKFTIEWDDE